MPAAPQRAGATLSNDRRVELVWAVSERAEQYAVYRGLVHRGPYQLLLRTSDPAAIDATAVYGNTYYYVIQALGTAGPSKLSKEMQIAITPAAPNGLFATATQAGISLSWTAALGETGGYVIASSVQGSTPRPIGNVNGTTFTDPQPAKGLTTSYLVAGVNAAGTGDAARASAQTLPAAPALTATSASTSVQLSWSAVPGAINYLVSRDGLALTVVTASSFNDTGLAVETTYGYQVQAFDESGGGGASTLSATTGPLPPAGASAAGADSEAIVVWSPVSDADVYVVSRSSTQGGPFAVLASAVVDTSFTDQSVIAGAQYFYQVVATKGLTASDPASASVIARGVAVRQSQTFVSDSGEADFPVDLSGGVDVVAIVPGLPAPIQGVGTASGDLVLPGVPAGGSYLLRLGGLSQGFSYFSTSARALDLGFATAGRQDAQPATVSPTNLDLDLTNLTPWDTKDTLELIAYGANDTLFGVEQLIPPAAFDTALSGPLDFAAAAENLIDTSQGDQLWFLQLTSATSGGGFAYQALTAALQLSKPLVMQDGVASQFAGPLAAVPQQLSQVAYLRSQFKAFAGAINPAATSGTDLLDFQAAPGYRAHGNYVAAADLALLVTDNAASDLAVGSFSFGAGLAGWDSFLQVSSTFSVPVLAPGATTPASVTATLTRNDRLDSFPLASIAPLLGPPTKPLINGKDAFTPQQGTGLLPVLRWSPPTLGVPTSYRVTLFQLTNSNGTTRTTRIARLATTDTALSLPDDGLLTAGSAYFAIIEARLDGVDTVLAPLRRSANEATAVLITSSFQP